MGIALHPDSVGRPHDLCHLRTALANSTAWREHIWFTTAGTLHDAARVLPAGVVSGDPHVIPGADT
ncbi:MAG: hypothetical protein RML45_06590 [Acetobacteraceae bacterium]|nr:hypothetical protein [Acetobacteraceae bacterium]